MVLFHHWAGTTTKQNQTVKWKIWEKFRSALVSGLSYSIFQSFAIFLQVLIEYEIHIFLKLLIEQTSKSASPILHPWTCDWYIMFALSTMEKQIQAIQHKGELTSSIGLHVCKTPFPKFSSLFLVVFDNNCYSNLNTRQFGRREAYHNGQLRGEPNDGHTRLSYNSAIEMLPLDVFFGGI